MNNDLISRSALKETIDNYAEKRQDILLWQSDIEDLIDNAPTVPLPNFKDGYKQAIIDGKTNFSRPQDEWIKVNERLPKIGEQVLCCNDCGSVFTSAITYISESGKAKFGKHYGVIAWKPLPQPFKKGE